MLNTAQCIRQLFTVRKALSLVLAFALFPWLGTARPALANGPSRGGPGAPSCASDPDARVQLFLKHVIVFDDGDLLSSGEIKMRFSVGQRGLDRCPELEHHLVTSQINFSADSGDVVVLNRPIPRDDDGLGVGVTETFGLPLFEGADYEVFFELSESDTLCCQYDAPDDNFPKMNAQNGWSIGSHEYRTNYDVSPAVTISYEVRAMPLPDLHPTDITLLAIPGNSDQELVCMGVENKGSVEAGPFQAALLINDQPAVNGVAQAGRLGAGQQGDLCVQTRLPTNERYQLSAVIDEPRGIFEINERNNSLDRQFLGMQLADKLEPLTGLVIEPADEHPSAPGPADLIVDAINVKGKDPDGQSDCDPGKNDVTIVVKNQGTGAAGPFTVRVAVGNESTDVDEQSAPSLAPGKSQDVTFDNFNLKKKEHTITATADTKNVVQESNENNNAKSVTVSCKDES